MRIEAAQQLTLQAAFIGLNGLTLQDLARIQWLEGFPEPVSGLGVACLIQAGVQVVSPGAVRPPGFTAEALKPNISEKGSPHRCPTHHVKFRNA